MPMWLPVPPKSLLPGQGRGFEKFYEASREISALEMGQGAGVWGGRVAETKNITGQARRAMGLSLLPLQADQLLF